MRDLVTILTCVLVASSAKGADQTIPQDLAKIEKRAADQLAWQRSMTVGAYDRVGEKDPRWDDLARKALDLVARQNGERGASITNDEIFKEANAAIAAGSRDPLLVYVVDRISLASKDLPAEELLRRRKSSAKAYAASRYPAVRRVSGQIVSAALTIAEQKQDAQAKASVTADIDAALGLLAVSVQEGGLNEFWEKKWFDVLQDCLRNSRWTGLEGPAAFAKVDQALAKLPEIKALRLRYRGWFWLAFGWEARTKAFAVAVPPGGFQTLEERVAEAKKSFEESWAIDHDAYSAWNLLDIDKSLVGDRETMELWFDRAIRADGDNQTACWAKLDWLDPKWHGTPEEMVAFGRACLATKNWQAGITILVADAHNRYSEHFPPEEKQRYMGSPEVWSDIKTSYDEYLRHYPNDHVERSRYAAFSFYAMQYDVSHAQFEILGDKMTSWTNFPYVPYEVMKLIRGEVARKVAEAAAAKKPKP